MILRSVLNMCIKLISEGTRKIIPSEIGFDQSAHPCTSQDEAEPKATYDSQTNNTISQPIMATSTISNGLAGMQIGGGIEPSPFPAKTKQVAGLVNGVETDLTSMYFADKILITISQGGRLAQWVYILCQPTSSHINELLS